MSETLSGGSSLFSFFQRYRTSIIATVGVLLFVGFVFFFYRESGGRNFNEDVTVSDLDRYADRIKKSPYKGSLLLRSARHHFFLVRKKLKGKGSVTPEIRRVIERGLRQYHRLQSVDGWSISKYDYFYNAYLFYQLAQIHDNKSRRNAYYNRAKQMALNSYELGYRSPELITLLGNLHYRTGEFDVALDYYSSLGNDVRDPEIVFNKAWVYRSQGEYEKAETLVRKAIDLSPRENDDRLRQYELSLVRILLDREKYREAIDRIQSIPNYENSLRARTLYADGLVGLGYNQEAVDILEDIVKRDDAPERAHQLYEKLSSDRSDLRS